MGPARDGSTWQGDGPMAVLITEAPLTANVAAEKAVAIIIGLAGAANRQAARGPGWRSRLRGVGEDAPGLVKHRQRRSMAPRRRRQG